MPVEVLQQLSEAERVSPSKIKTDEAHDFLGEKKQQPYLQKQDMYESEVIKVQPKTLKEYVAFFDKEMRSSELPWYTLDNKVGFSMKSQMQLLDMKDTSSVDRWAVQTKQDLLGFCLEYLSDKLVYPYKYEEVTLPNGEASLRDTKYGKDILETTSAKERNGSVLDALKEVKTFFVREAGDTEKPSGKAEQSIAVMCSPLGPSGLETDNGESIHYPDSYWFIFERKGKEIRGVTIRTDFTITECREALRMLTGKVLPEGSLLEDYARALTCIPGEKQKTAFDIVDTLRQARAHVTENTKTVFGDKKWDEVISDMKQGQSLYEFNDKTKDVIKEFEEYVTTNQLSQLDIQKALAATFLRLSKLFILSEEDQESLTENGELFEEILTRVASIPGCAGGGGGVTAVESAGGIRLGMLQEKTLKCKECPLCKEKDIVATISNGKITCPKCGKSAPYDC